ncbi:MAG: hypothetical protein OXE99_07710 [Cellvibrionales bacterium]|nr:hypothetical protein [Cellvibrionales bacterium]
MLYTYEQWIKNKKFAPGSEPSITRVRNWIKKGILKGEIIDKEVWVDPVEPQKAKPTITQAPDGINPADHFACLR